MFIVQPHVSQIRRIVPHIHGLSDHLECFGRIHVPQILPVQLDPDAVSLDLLHLRGAGKHQVQVSVRGGAHAHLCNGLVPDLDPAHAFVFGLGSAVFFTIENAIDPGFQRFGQCLVLWQLAAADDVLQTFFPIYNIPTVVAGKQLGKLLFQGQEGALNGLRSRVSDQRIAHFTAKPNQNRGRIVPTAFASFPEA